MWISQKHKYLEISKTKHYFFFNWKDSLITYQGLLYDKKNFVAEVTFKSIKNLKIQRQKRSDSNHYRSIPVLKNRLNSKIINMKNEIIVYLTFNLALHLLISHLRFCMLDFVLQNALLNLCQNTQIVFKNQPTSKTYQRKMESR